MKKSIFAAVAAIAWVGAFAPAYAGGPSWGSWGDWPSGRPTGAMERQWQEMSEGQSRTRSWRGYGPGGPGVHTETHWRTRTMGRERIRVWVPRN